MKRIDKNRIREILKEARIVNKSLKSTLLSDKIKRLSIMRSEYCRKRKELLNVKKRYKVEINKIRKILDSSISKIEIEILRKGGNIYRVLTNVPKNLNNIVKFLENNIERLESMKIPSIGILISQLKEQLEISRIFCEKEKSEVLPLEKELDKIATTIDTELNEIKQFLNPTQNIIVNVRDRFD
ncbi:MAG: hypothetical protein N2746_00870 [Deltaproteobacteria bacterium]|nr:hypothetical protein [Deltaproteobacteria bacterium]